MYSDKKNFVTFLALQILPVKERGGTKISLVMSKERVCSGNQFVSNSFSLFPATNQIAERRNFFNSGTISQRIHGDDNPEFLLFGQKSCWHFFWTMMRTFSLIQSVCSFLVYKSIHRLSEGQS